MAGNAGSLALRTAATDEAARPVATDPRRPLFLGARVRGRVDKDGPALRIRAAGRAEARYPLARVSRVIASPGVDWSAGALRACMDNGVPIVIVGDDGEPIGSFYPAQARVSRLAEDIEEMLDRPDWSELYETWLRAARMRIMREWQASRPAEGGAEAAREFAEAIRRYVYGAYGERPLEDAAGLWRGALHALAAGALRRAGVRPIYWGAGGQPLRLLRDLASLLELRLRLDISAGMERGLEGEAVVLRVFQALSETLETLAGRSIESLARRLKQVLNEWR